MSEETNPSISNGFAGTPEQIIVGPIEEASNNIEMDIINPQENQSSVQNTDQSAAQSVESAQPNNNIEIIEINEQNREQHVTFSRSYAFNRLRFIEAVSSPRPENNLIRIQQRKKHLRELPREKKMLHLANSSQCQCDKCTCTGWKRGDGKNPYFQAETTDSFEDICGACKHTLEQHVLHLMNQSDELINTLLGLVVDIDSVFTKKSKEIDPDLVQIYNFILKHFRKSILNVEKPLGLFTEDGPLGHPPFEKPSILSALSNFLIYKFKHLNLDQWNMMCDMSRLFIHCLNQWKWETLHSKKKSINSLEALTYKINYTRYIVFCNISAYCDSLPHMDVVNSFGKTALRLVFNAFCKQLVYNFFNGKKEMPTDKRVFFTQFMITLEAEVYKDDSPMWDPKYKPTIPPHLQTSKKSAKQ